MSLTIDLLLDLIRVVTPFITLLTMILVGVLGWFFTRLIRGVESKIDNNFCQLSSRLDKVELEVESLKVQLHAWEVKARDRFVDKETFWKDHGANQRMAEDLYSKINAMKSSFDQWVGILKERQRKGD